MNKYIKYIAFIVLVVIFGFLFNGNYSVQSIDDLAYAIAIGIDVGETNEYKVTFEFIKPLPTGESGAGEASPTVINSVEANSLDAAINLMNTYVSKEINLSHCKIIVLSESLASNGISRILYSLINKVQIRPDVNLVVSKCLAKEFIEHAQPNLENLVAKYFETLPISSEYTGYTANIKLDTFFNQFSSITCEPTAMLGAINTSEQAKLDTDSGFSSEKTTQSTAGNTPLSNTGASEMMGLAVFKGDKLVGELTAKETMCHLLIRDELESCNISIPNPEDSKQSIDLYVYNKSKPKIKVQIVNGSPFISLDMNLEAKILSFDDTSQYMEKEQLEAISNSANQYIQKIISEYLYKTSKEFYTDIDDFGKYAACLFKTSQDFEEYNWLENYRNAFFDISVNTNVQSAFLLSGE